MPDIYYIVLDNYTGYEELKDLLGYDNKTFITYLKEKGFYVVKKGNSNYAWTGSSIASSLNMQYLPQKQDSKNPKLFKLDEKVDLSLLIEDNQVIRLLKSKGYKYVDLSLNSKQLYKSSDYLLRRQDNVVSFSKALLQMTVLELPVVGYYLEVKTKKDDTDYKFSVLEAIPHIKEPTFVYAHIMICHTPYIFDQDGNINSLKERLLPKNQRKLYIEQIKYANKLTKRLINVLIEDSGIQPIIIIQGDHGAFDLCETYGENVRLRMSILNAYYLPENGNALLYDFITPVNTFRIIFKKYLGIQYELLPDKSYYHHSNSKNTNMFLIN
jgi:hypothetical protein